MYAYINSPRGEKMSRLLNEKLEIVIKYIDSSTNNSKCGWSNPVNEVHKINV